MEDQHKVKSYSAPVWPYWVGLFAIIVGLVLTGVSALNLCEEECAFVHDYRLYGLPFEAFGFIFFPILAILHLYSSRSRLISFIEGCLVFGAVGAEFAFILFQKNIIGEWCHVCLSIAGCVLLLGVALFYRAYYRFYEEEYALNKDSVMFGFKKGFISSSVIILGFVVALSGITKNDATYYEEFTEAGNPSFGSKTSPVDVFFITDWLCPLCVKLEPRFQRMYPSIMKQASLYFIDRAIHPDSLNFSPYNLSFMIYNKDKYFQIRDALHELAVENHHPTVEQVQKAVSSLGVKYKPLDFSNVNGGVHFFDYVNKTFKVNATPSVVVANHETKESKTFIGSEEIHEREILEAIKELSVKE